MAVSILKNNIAAPQYAAAIETAVRRGIGETPGSWRVGIEEPRNHVAWTIWIEGPADFEWAYEFFGQEQTPDFIERTVTEEVTRHRLRSQRSL